MDARKFHITDVLSVTADCLISTRHTDGVLDLLSFMSDDYLNLHQVPRVADECTPYLLRQFPELDAPEIHIAVAELKEMLKTSSGGRGARRLVLGWVSELISGQYGIKVAEMLDVEKLPPDVHNHINTICEMAEKMHP